MRIYAVWQTFCSSLQAVEGLKFGLFKIEIVLFLFSLLFLLFIQMLLFLYLGCLWYANENHAATVMALELCVFGHSTVWCNQIHSTSSNITDLLVLLNVGYVLLFKLWVFKYPFNLVYFFVDILLLHPLFPKLVYYCFVREIYHNAIANNFT